MPNLNHATAEQVRSAIADAVPADQVDAVLAKYIKVATLPPATPGETSPYANFAPDPSGPSWSDALDAAQRQGIPVSELPARQLPRLIGDPVNASSADTEALLTTPGEVSPPESEDTSSGFSNTQKKRICSSLRKDGQPCRAYDLSTGDLCIYHESDDVTNFNEAQSRGGSARRRSVIDLESLPVNLHNAVEFHAFLETFLRMQLAGAIPESSANRIIRTLRLLQGSFEFLRYRSSTNPAGHYGNILETLLDAADDIGDRLAQQESFDRAEKIEDVGASRREYLRANQDFGHNQPRPTREPSPSHPSNPFNLPKFTGFEDLLGSRY
ncbi:MAG: hypothetical protein AB7J35_13710 [Dehalococcoidia bacterium]